MDRPVNALGIVLLAATIELTVALGSEEGVLLIKNTVRLALVWYVVAICLMLFFQPGDWTAGTARGRLARWCWTWALLCFLVHLVFAFQFFHHWSHADAFARSLRMSGLGEGIYIAYLFTVLWMADVIFWWARADRYAARGAWIDRSLHGFMLFVVLQGTIVFDKGPIRVAGAVGMVVLAAAWWLAHRRRGAAGRVSGRPCGKNLAE